MWGFLQLKPHRALEEAHFNTAFTYTHQRGIGGLGAMEGNKQEGFGEIHRNALKPVPGRDKRSV